MNDLYNETVVRNGKTYHYDPDMDCYYCRSTDEGPISRWAWLVTIPFLAAIAYYAEYLR